MTIPRLERKPLRRVTASIHALGTLAVLGVATRVAPAQCPEEPVLQNWTGGGSVTCPCFIQGEQAGVILDAPASHYPIEILRIQIGWGSQFGGAPQSLEAALHLYASGLPSPGSPQFSLPAPVLTDGSINEFDISLTPGNKTINSGPFMISLEFQNSNAGMIFAPSVVHDGNGCQPGKNSVFAIPGGWNDACLLGVSGNWVMGVVYRQTNCTTPATCTIRNGSGVNPLGFTCVTNPVLGANWISNVTTNASTLNTTIGLGFAGPPLPFMGGEYLLSLAVSPLFIPGTFGTHVVPIPNIPSLSGATLSSQGFRVDNSGVLTLVMLNAIDLQLGS